MAKGRYSIRVAEVTDVPALLQCLGAAFKSYRSCYTVDAFLDTVLTDQTARERLASMTVLLAVDDSAEVIGTIASARESDTVGHLRGMAILPEWQGSGVAQALLDRALNDLAGSGCDLVTLDTTHPLRRAVHFYEKNGFRRSGKVCDFFGMPLIEYCRDLKRQRATSSLVQRP